MSNLLSTIISSGYQNIAIGRKSGIFSFINPDALTRCVRTEKTYKPKPYSSIFGGLSNTAGFYSLLNNGHNYTSSTGSYSTAIGISSTTFGYNSILK